MFTIRFGGKLIYNESTIIEGALDLIQKVCHISEVTSVHEYEFVITVDLTHLFAFHLYRLLWTVLGLLN